MNCRTLNTFKRWTHVQFLLIALLAMPAFAAPDSQGTDFWVMFPGNYLVSEQSLFITSGVNTSGTVEVPGLAFSMPFNVVANTVTTVALPSGVDIQNSDLVENLGVHITSNEEITVYGLSARTATTDAFLGLPTDVLGTDYINLGYENVNILNATQFGIVGTQDNTTVTITPTETTGARVAGVPYNIVLNQGQTYMLRNTNPDPADLSGTTITSDLPIGVFGGHQCANIPNSNPQVVACDHITEQLPPTSAWGQSFLSVPLETRLNGDTFRFLASTNGTTVNVNGVPVAVLNRGELHEQILVGAAQITADQPILVAQYSNSSSFDNVVSDPFMMLIPPFEQFLLDYTVTTPSAGFPINFINIVAPSGAVGAITLDGAPIPAVEFSAIGASGFSGAAVAVAVGSHNLGGPAPFGVFSYGFSNFDSYGYPGGLSLSPIAQVTTLLLTPETATNQVDTEHCVVATVLDQDDNPLEGIRVDFAVNGAHNVIGSVNTDANGESEFCYTGTVAGTDTIVATVGNLTQSVEKIWISNLDPDCSAAAPSIDELWPPNHKWRDIDIVGVTDPDGDPVTITVTGVTQDEPLDGAGDGNTCADALLTGGQLSLRAERSGLGDGRVYVISFTAEDGQGGSCDGTVSVCVPHDRGQGSNCVDSGQSFNSFGPCDLLVANHRGRATLRFTQDRQGMSTFEYSLAQEAEVDLRIYNVAGRQVGSLVSARLGAGVHRVQWDSGQVSSGIYYARLRVGETSVTRSIVLVK